VTVGRGLAADPEALDEPLETRLHEEGPLEVVAGLGVRENENP